MNQSKFHHEAERWLETASEDLRAARTLRADQLFAHACFMAQQCGEKAVKAMWYAIGQEPSGQSIQKLVMDFPESQKIPDIELWRQHAATLDKFYSATRYPNVLPDLTPGSSYFLRDADQAIEYANVFLRAARELLPTSQPVQSFAPLPPAAHIPASLPADGIEAKMSLSPPVTKAAFTSAIPSAPMNVSSGEDHHHRRRKQHSTRNRVTRFLMQRETWVVAIILILAAIILGLIIPSFVTTPRGRPMVLEMIPILVSRLAALV